MEGPTTDPQEVEELRQRELLFERLARIQRSISHHAPLQEVLDAITAGARELLGDEVVGLRLIDEDDPGWCVLVSSSGIPEKLRAKLRRTGVGEGAGGLAIERDELVVFDNYAGSQRALEAFIADGLQAAMAAPVHESGRPVGSLVVASYTPGRRYARVEHDVLLAFAQHASLALTDAKLLDAMREAQRYKDMFFAMVSHELKTPLTVIVGNLQTVLTHYDRLDVERRKLMLTTACERAHDLASMIDRLLAGSRAELAQREQEISLADLVSDATKGFTDSGRLTVRHVPEVVVRVDVEAVTEIIGILLENTVTHSDPDAPISVRANIDGGRVSVAVANAGSLPPNTDPSKLFEAFHRGPGARSAGVGLGLHIASQLARSLHGTLDVTSATGQVEFTLSWPLDSMNYGRAEMHTAGTR